MSDEPQTTGDQVTGRESEADAPLAGGCPLCRAAYPDIAAEVCTPAHTESTQRLAYAVAAMVHGDNPTAEQAGWFVDDAEAIARSVKEGDGWQVVPMPDLRDNPHWSVNGTEWWLDINAEGRADPRPISDWDDDG